MVLTDLSDLAAQTDAFVRAQRPLTGREVGSNASSPTIPSQTNRPSSYSSVVSSAARTSSPDQLPATVSGTAKPSATSITSFGVDVGHRSSGAGSATGLCFIDTAHVVCGAGSMKLSGVHLSVGPILTCGRFAAAGPAGRRYRLIAAQRICIRCGYLLIHIHSRRVVSSRCEHYHVYSVCVSEQSILHPACHWLLV